MSQVADGRYYYVNPAKLAPVPINGRQRRDDANTT
jgi:hypothetical protein